MAFQASISRLQLSDRRTLISLLAAPTVTYFVAKLLYNFVKANQSLENAIYRAPRNLLPLLQSEDPSSLPYPPDALPGARDVETPYGNIRVYEWGPPAGRKVLFVHGISTPCIALAGLAQRLAEQQGCRVMLFDLFGRGYSDAPDPETFPQDVRLWTTQIMLVLGSSDLSWTGEGNAFTMVGYSLGGGISAAFASYFPQLVERLVLVAPAGLIRPTRVHWSSKLIYGGLMPARAVDWLVTRRLKGRPTQDPPKGALGGNPEQTATSPGETVKSEVSEHPALTPDSNAALFPDRPGISVAKAVAWQAEAHPGFVPAFISSIQRGPISDQHDLWRRIGARLTAQRASASGAGAGNRGLKGQVLLLLGKQDAVIIPEETADDATEVFGKENTRVEVLEGGHDVPIANAEGCARVLAEFLGTS